MYKKWYARRHEKVTWGFFLSYWEDRRGSSRFLGVGTKRVTTARKKKWKKLSRVLFLIESELSKLTRLLFPLWHGKSARLGMGVGAVCREQISQNQQNICNQLKINWTCSIRRIIIFCRMDISPQRYFTNNFLLYFGNKKKNKQLMKREFSKINNCFYINANSRAIKVSAYSPNYIACVWSFVLFSWTSVQ